VLIENGFKNNIIQQVASNESVLIGKMIHSKKDIEQLIDTLQLSPHPEGGYYREVYCSEKTVTSPVHGKIRHAMTDIYFLLMAGQKSRFHRIVHDEIWHFYQGAPLTLIEINSDTFEMSKVTLGDTDIKLKHLIKGGNWQSAYSNGDYSLVGCTVAPGFTFSDFSFLTDNDLTLESIVKKYPDLKELI